MALNAYIKIDGIAGGSTASKHKDEIEVLSFSWGIKNSLASGGGGGGGGQGKAEVSDFSFTKEVAKDSPELFVSVCTGEHHKNAILTVEGISTAKGASQSFYKVTFEDVLISGVILGGQGDSVPVETVSLNFSKVRLEFRDASGGTKAEVCDFRSTDF